MQPRRTQAGFTLVELMIVVLIIGIGAAMSASGVANAFSEDRARRATRELVRLARRARSETVQFRVSHLIWIELGANRASVLRGLSPSCTNQVWTGAVVTERLDLGAAGGTYAQDAWPAQMQLTVPAGVANLAICYSPTGLMWSATAAATLSEVAEPLLTQNIATGGFVIDIVRAGSGGVARHVLFPQGGAARVLQ